VGFPVLVQAQVKIKFRLPLQPRDVGARFGGFGIAVIAVQINATGILAPVQREADGIQARHQKNFRIHRPTVFLKQTQRGERSGGFVAVNAGGKVKARAIGRVARGAMQRQPFEISLRVENFRRPTIFLCGGCDVALNGANINRLAVVTAVVFAKFLHAVETLAIVSASLSPKRLST